MSITLIIVIITCIVSYIAFNNRSLFDSLKHHPYTENREGQWYRFISSGFVHGSFFHLLINMYVLYEFGQYVEQMYVHLLGDVWGRSAYLLMYLGTIAIADIPTYIKHKDNPGYASIGASGGVSGILFTFILFSPWSMLGLYFIIPVPAIIFGVLYLIYSSWASKNQNDMIDHDAHFFGALTGMIITIALAPSVFTSFISKFVEGLPF